MASSTGSWLVKFLAIFVAVVGLIASIIQIAEFLNKPPAVQTAPTPAFTAATAASASLPTVPPAPTSTTAPTKGASPVAPTLPPTIAPTLPPVPTLVPTLPPTLSPTLPPVPTQTPTAPPNTSPPCTAAGQTSTSPMDGMTLVCMPAGKFTMGSAASDTNADTDERPQHEVSLSAYWIDKTEVTNRQFELFVKARNYQTDAEKLGSGIIFTGSSWVDTKGAFWKQPKGPGSDLNGKSEHPVVMVSWNDADAYCRWAGRNLPTEAQWEMAGRGTDGRLYPWGYAASDANRANFNLIMKDTTQVGKYQSGASPYGVMDMAGNVWEWVADWYDRNYYNVSSSSNPLGPVSGGFNVLRGGGWYDNAYDLRVANRYYATPTTRTIHIGFRCAAPSH